MVRILYVADGFPDGRVEKGILTGLKNKFIIGIAYWGKFNPIFKELESVPHWQFKLDTKTQLGLASKQSIESLSKIVADFKPDIIHVHDIFNARIAVKLNKKMVYDDHEFWSEQLKYEKPYGTFLTVTWLRRAFGLFLRKRFVKRWEKEVSSRSVVICAHPKVAEYHKQFSSNVFVVPNYPSLRELESLSSIKLNDKQQNLIAYIGGDISSGGGYMRKMKHFPGLIRKSNKKLIVVGDPNLQSDDFITSVGYVKHLTMYEYLMKASWGIIAWEPHPFHEFCNPNKIFLYAHSGLFVIMPSMIAPQGLKFYKTFIDYTDLSSILNNDYKFNPSEIIEHARNHLTWEVLEPTIIKAYDSLLKFDELN